jgi:hypothetical protein
MENFKPLRATIETTSASAMLNSAAAGHCQSIRRKAGFDFSRLFILTLTLFFGCATANTGYLKHSRDVAKAFETYQIFADHRYYYLNQENNPFAVAALKSPYTLRDNLWTEFDPQSDQLEKVVGLIEGFPVNYSYPYGAYLMDRQGNQIGYWYSSLRMAGITVDNETQRVSISTEMPWLWDDDWGYGPGGSGVGIRFGF